MATFLIKHRCEEMKFSINSLVNIFAGLFILVNLLDAVPLGRRKNYKEDLLCNIGDDHECVCNRSTGNLDNVYMPCHEFLEVRSLDVVSMVLRDINLNARLYTNETYEQYLRRRIAQILSQYCENISEECPGTLAEIRSQKKKDPTFVKNAKMVTVFDEGPVFSRGSIVILRVEYPPGYERTELSFVVLKMANTVRINPSLMLDPTTVKYILSAQFAPLSRVLGGIKIEQFGIEKLEKPVSLADNTILLIIISVIAIFMTICCTIAAAKVMIDIRRARRQKRQNKETQSEKKNIRNYGTCTDKLFSSYNNYEVPNGRAKSKPICSREWNNSKKTKKDKKISKCSSEIAKVAIQEAINNDEENSPRVVCQNIFICDHSQLPKEDGDEEFKIEVKRTKRQSLHVQPTRSPFSSDDDTAFQTFQFPDRPSKNGKRFSFSENIPCVILEDGTIGNGMGKEESEPNAIITEEPILQLTLTPKSAGGHFLSTDEAIERPQSRIGGHPFDRPLSRRGSRDEKAEEGEEETFNDTREDTPVPLGDDQVLVEKPLIDMLMHKTKQKVEKLMLTSETDSEEENTEDDEGNALYKPLKKEESKNRRRDEKEGESSSEAGEEKNEHEMLERHQYERLLESPMLPPTNEAKPTPKIIRRNQFEHHLSSQHRNLLQGPHRLRFLDL